MEYFKESTQFIGKVPKYEDYMASSLVEDEESNEKQLSRGRSSGGLYFLSGMLMTLPTALGLMALGSWAGIQAGRNVEQVTQYNGLVTVLFLVSLTLVLISYYTAYKLKAEYVVNDSPQDLFEGNLKLKDGTVINIEDDYTVGRDYISSLNSYVVIENNNKKGITRLYNILDTYDDGRIMNSISFRYLRDNEKEEAKLRCEEEELSISDLIKVFKVLSMDYYLGTENGNKTKAKSEIQKQKEKEDLNYDTSIVKQIGVLNKNRVKRFEDKKDLLNVRL